MNGVDLAVAFALRHLLLSVVFCGVVLLLMRSRALGAERRSWLLLAVFVLAAALPFAAFLPRWTTTLPSAEVQTERIVALPAEGVAPAEAVYEAGQRPDWLYLEIPWSLSSALLLVWLLGTLWQLMRLADGWRQSRRLRRSARAAPALEAALGASLPRNARIATTVADGPLVIGLLRPCILLPRALTTALAPGVLHDVLRHEIAHIRRGDLWLVAALRIVTALFWWNPFLQWIGARLELAREMACDARAAHGCDSSADYADSLLASVDALLELDEQRDWLAVTMVGARSHLAQRIDGLVDDRAIAAAPRRAAATALCLIMLAACSSAVVAALPRLALPAGAAAPDAQVTALLAAARSGDDAAVQRLVRAGVDVDARVLDGGTALIQAVRAGDAVMVDTLLKLGADPDRASLGQGNPLIAAARLGRQSIVERLVAAGADVDRVVTYDETPLINAARAGHLATVRYLVAHGADVRFGVEADGWLGRWRTPLNQTRDPAVRAYLLEQGANAPRR